MKKSSGKVRVIVASHSMRAKDAIDFRQKNEFAFDGKYLFSGRYFNNGHGGKFPMYHVVWIPPEGFEPLPNYYKWVDESEILEKIPLAMIRRESYAKVR